MFHANDSIQVQILPGFYEPNNLENRVHAAPIFDFSGSMSAHAPRLPGAWGRMVAALSKRTIERLQIELACCVFDTHVVFQDYAPVPFYLEKPLSFVVGGATSLGTALLTVIDSTRQRRQMLASEGIYSRPAICPVVTDGYATDSGSLEHAVREIRFSEEHREIQFVFLAPDGQCVPQLRSVFGREPIPLDEINFERLFDALTRSLSSYSRSTAGHEPDARRLLEYDIRSSGNEAV
jgi:uncharacterized protein YegL